MVFMPKSLFRWAFYTVPRASMFDGKLCGESLGLEKSAVGRCGLLPLHSTAISPSTLWYNEDWEKCDSISRERCR